MQRLLEVTRLPPGSRFVDLGSGRGLAALSAASLGYPACGLEFFPEYVERASGVAAELKRTSFCWMSSPHYGTAG